MVGADPPEKMKECIVTEGFANAMSLHEATNLPTFAVLSVGNFKKVIPILRRKYGSKCKIYIAPDNDQAKEFETDKKGNKKINVGMTTAHDLATKYKCNALPIEPEKGSNESIDFNELHRSKGIDAVRKAFENACKPKPKLAFVKKLQNQIIGKPKFPKIESLPNGITFIKSPQNTGKTTSLIPYIKDLRNKGKSVLLVTHRESLAVNLGKKFGLAVYKHFDDLTSLNLQSGLAICINSLYKLKDLRTSDGKAPHFDTVVIDESEQFVRNLKSRHIEHKQENLERLKDIVGGAEQLICLDADLGLLTEKFTQQYRPNANDNINRMTNFYPVAENKRVIFVERKGTALAEFYRAIENGERVVFFCNSLNLSRSVFEQTSSKYPYLKGLLVNSETANTEEVKTVMADADLFNTYDYCVSSPSIQTGISIDGYHFNKVICSFTAGVGISDDFIQQMWRVRNATELIIWTDSRNIYKKCKEEEIRIDINNTRAEEAKRLNQKSFSSYNPEYEALHDTATSYENWDRQNLRYNTIEKITLQGANTIIAEDGAFAGDGFVEGLRERELRLEAIKAEIELAKEASKITTEAGKRVYVRDRLEAIEHHS